MAVAAGGGSLPVYIKSPLARVMYNKLLEDNAECNDHSEWYAFNCQSVTAELAAKFVQFSEDAETTDFLHSSREKSDWLFTQLFHSLMKFILSWVMTSTSVNGLLQRGSMFVFSESQIDRLLNVDYMWKAERLLDLGAGDGAVTQKLARHFDEVYVTEMSTTMIWRLKDKNYRVLGIDEWASGERLYDVISCLNLLDRCEEPMNLLAQIRSVLKPNDGRLILAVVLPFHQFVEFGDSSHKPRQYLRIEGRTFEEQVNSFVSDVISPAGYEVETFSRLPYLCEGDLYHSYYVLHDVIFVLRRADVPCYEGGQNLTVVCS